ncbi:MAG: hypothetical protein HW387_191 [Parachlamydiales bacterium]|nr:hypothetical protein [Parachlamydiales bacterium]
MLVSMTGFGRFFCNAPFGKLVVEIQSVNRKYLEISISLPKELNRFEMEIRKWVQELISRGQVNVRLFLTPNDAMLDQLLPDANLLKRLKKSWVKLAKASGTDPKDINLPFLLQYLPPVSLVEIVGSEEEQISALRECIEAALQGVVEMKKREGHAMAIDIGQRLGELERLISRVEKAAPDAVARQRQKLRERIQEVLAPGAELDERLLREIALFAERVDISEEIIRFHSHISQFREVLKGKNAQVGRKLDFLVQEMGREINTIGSKSADAAISRFIVDGKSELEKVREQIQNIE